MRQQAHSPAPAGICRRFRPQSMAPPARFVSCDRGAAHSAKIGDIGADGGARQGMFGERSDRGYVRRAAASQSPPQTRRNPVTPSARRLRLSVIQPLADPTASASEQSTEAIVATKVTAIKASCGPSGLSGVMNCGKKAPRKSSTFGFDSDTAMPCQNQRPRRGASSACGSSRRRARRSRDNAEPDQIGRAEPANDVEPFSGSRHQRSEPERRARDQDRESRRAAQNRLQGRPAAMRGAIGDEQRHVRAGR